MTMVDCREGGEEPSARLEAFPTLPDLFSSKLTRLVNVRCTVLVRYGSMMVRSEIG
jgi:hypothetical protein